MMPSSPAIGATESPRRSEPFGRVAADSHASVVWGEAGRSAAAVSRGVDPSRQGGKSNERRSWSTKL